MRYNHRHPFLCCRYPHRGTLVLGPLAPAGTSEHCTILVSVMLLGHCTLLRCQREHSPACLTCTAAARCIIFGAGRACLRRRCAHTGVEVCCCVAVCASVQGPTLALGIAAFIALATTSCSALLSGRREAGSAAHAAGVCTVSCCTCGSARLRAATDARWRRERREVLVDWAFDLSSVSSAASDASCLRLALQGCLAVVAWNGLRPHRRSGRAELPGVCTDGC